ncbi:MAG: hydrolase 1, exosortase A system-associated [Burkholderiales bacterium PBB5]|nr:MAG: hydrolase 1, exosortase A system-associated [Burkholderiales bacterium PBB5]
MTAESVLHWRCGEATLLGVLTAGAPQADTAVLVIVGGPQYRAGSHRQFVRLGRALAAHGWPTLRFDYRGMGDSGGDPRTFDSVGEDIGSAIDALCRRLPSLRRVVLWGLCDGASAALMYWQESQDPRVAGLSLLNPWLRGGNSEARMRVRHYYLQRLTQGDFWRKLLRGGIGADALSGLARQVSEATQRGPAGDADFRDRMAWSWQHFPGPVQVLLSGRDFTAKEFLDGIGTLPTWRGAWGRPLLTRCDLPEADHTVSAESEHQRLVQAVRDWLSALPAAPLPDPSLRGDPA